MAPSSPSTSKRKDRGAPDTNKNAHPSKKLRKSAVDGAVKKDKGKARDREFQLVTSDMVVSVSPVFAGNPRAGVEEMLDSLVMRYIPALQGVVLSHSNLTFTSNTGDIKNDCPFLICNIRFDATIWNPHMGMKLKGRINLSSPDHISLLLHRTFNVSIPRHHIPADEWEFEYGPAENDPEFANADKDEAEEEEEKDEEDEGEGEEKAAEEDEEEDAGSGRWVHRSTGERLGGSSGIVEFTVIGLTVANEMLSLVGSIQPDPFSPSHQPYTSPSTTTSPSRKSKSLSRSQKASSNPVPEEEEEETDDQEEEEEELEAVDSEDEEEEGMTLLLKRKKALTPPPEVEKPAKKKRKSKKNKA